MKTLEDNIEYIGKSLEEIHTYGLTTEVVVYALHHMKENPSLSILEAFEAGCMEWDV
jgi:hypothetical protein